ncbi:MAG: ribokinase [Sciscionella sp.]
MPDRHERAAATTRTTHPTGQVVVIGSINIDHVVRTDVFPAPGETVTGSDVHVGLGGKGANQAVAAHIAGADVRMLARIGDDAEGELARRRLAERGVDVSGVLAVSGSATGTAWITVTPQDNTIVVVPGANARWEDEQRVASDAVTLAQLEIPLAVVERAAARCTGRFVLNAAPARPLPDSLLAHCDVLIVNEHELRTVSGGPPVGNDITTIEAAHLALLDRGAGAVLTTMGAAGAALSDAHGTLTLRPYAADVVDTTGAGDVCAGAIAARLAEGDSLRDAADWGMAAGSLAVRRAGAQESFPTATEITTLLQERTLA